MREESRIKMLFALHIIALSLLILMITFFISVLITNIYTMPLEDKGAMIMLLLLMFVITYMVLSNIISMKHHLNKGRGE